MAGLAMRLTGYTAPSAPLDRHPGLRHALFCYLLVPKVDYLPWRRRQSPGAVQWPRQQHPHHPRRAGKTIVAAHPHMHDASSRK